MPGSRPPRTSTLSSKRRKSASTSRCCSTAGPVQGCLLDAQWGGSGAGTPDQLKAIFAEAEPDFSAEICAAATLEDLTPEAVERFRDMWQQDSGNPALAHLSVPRLLEDAELLVNGQITYAALVLFGTRKALGRHLAQSEVILPCIWPVERWSPRSASIASSMSTGHDHVQEIEPPLMVIEILSAGQTVEDLIAKADAYFEGGVRSCWIVQPVLETIAVLVPGEKPKIHGTGELTDPATAITVKVEEVFS
jgi:hypothetical protein